MKKISLQLPTGDWDDLTTKYAADDNRKVDQNAFTAGTKNIDTETDGTIRKMKGGTQFYTLVTSNKDQYEAIFSDGTRHLLTVDGGDLRFTAGTAESTSVTTGFSAAANFEFATTRDRVYMGNIVNSNQVYDKTASYGGVGYSVPQTKDMGATVPSSAPTAALGAPGSNVPVGAHTYKVTYLYYDSQESNGSAASNLVTVTGADEQVDLTSIPIGGYGVTARKIYRDDNDSVYVLIGTLSDNTATTFSDTFAGGTTPIPTDNGAPPLFGQIKLFLDRLWFSQISGEPFTIYFSEVGLPDIVQSTNFIDGNPGDPITSLFVYRGRLIVFNRRSMGQVLGDTKDTFRYDHIEGSVGCVDNRSIQEIVLQGVPVLVWLSDKGFYGFNGSSIFYLSDNIEDLVNVNIKQAVVQKNQNVDTTNADFNAGTLSEGIAVAAGQVSVRGYVDGSSTIGSNPRRTWNDTSDWDGGSSLDNIVTLNQGNSITMVPDFSNEPATEGTKDNVIDDGGVGITLTSVTDHTGEDQHSHFTPNKLLPASGFAGNTAWAQEVTLERGGSLTNFLVHFSDSLFGGPGSPTPRQYTLKVWRDSLGVPGAVIFTSGIRTVTTDQDETANVSLGVSSGEKIWIGAEIALGGPTIVTDVVPGSRGLSGVGFSGPAKILSGGWVADASNTRMNMSYVFVQSAFPASGTWTSTVFDTQSTTADPDDLTFTATYPSGTGSTTTLEGGDTLDFAGNIVVDESENFTDLSGTVVITLGSRRFYQVKITLTTSDDRTVPDVSTAAVLQFDSTAEWISDSVDTTDDSTVYNALTTTDTTPGTSTVVTEIRTADTLGALPAAPFVAFGSVTVRKFAQVRLTFTKDAADNLPSVSLVDLTWTIVSNIVSAEIDTNVDPSGWDIFQTDFVANGGTVVFEMRSATTSGGLPGAVYSTVTNGNYPPAALPTEQFVQWRATITATDTNVPVIASVTIEWLVGDVDSVRAASIFFNKNYYIALAELANDENNIVLQLDAKGKWRIKRGLGISTLGFFFNDPYFGRSTAGVIGKFLNGLDDLGNDIEIDIRTRAFDFSSTFFDNSEFTKVPESLMIEGRGTGATYDVGYSLDDGATFTNFIDVTTGTTSFTTTNDDRLFSRVFRASDNNGARAIIYRVHTNDEFDVKLHRMKMSAFVTRKEPIITG